jgi:hypothetical protein
MHVKIATPTLPIVYRVKAIAEFPQISNFADDF